MFHNTEAAVRQEGKNKNKNVPLNEWKVKVGIGKDAHTVKINLEDVMMKILMTTQGETLGICYERKKWN